MLRVSVLFTGGRLKFLIDGLKLAAFALEEKAYSIGGKKIPSREEKWVQSLVPSFINQSLI